MATPRKPAPAGDRPTKLTIAEVAANENVSQATVRRWIARGELRAYRYGPRLLRIDPADVTRMRRQVAAATFRHSSHDDARPSGGDQA